MEFEEERASRLERLVESLELVTARMIETAVVNSQLASSQTPEMRGLFDAWIACVSDEVARLFEHDGDVSLDGISELTGLSRESALALLMCLDRRGRIAITSVTGGPGDGRNRDICDCMIK
jgi:hypothetical protein